MRPFVDASLWNRPSTEHGRRNHGDLPGDASPYAAPADATDLSGSVTCRLPLHHGAVDP